jgi:hypothetical protein
MNLFEFARQLGQPVCLANLSAGYQATLGDAEILFPTNPAWLPLRGVGNTKLQALQSLVSLMAVGSQLGKPGASSMLTEPLTVPSDWTDLVEDRDNHVDTYGLAEVQFSDTPVQKYFSWQ